MKVFVLTAALLLPVAAFATLECESALLGHFKTLKIDVDASRMTSDYLHPAHRKAGECVYKAQSMNELESIIEKAKKFKVADSRKNEIIRVCTAISAFVSLGLDETKIAAEILKFQNGWSEGMRTPLQEVIKSEMAYAQSGDDCGAAALNASERASSPEKPGTEAGSGSSPTGGGATPK